MNDTKYPKWIDEYSKAFHNAFKNMIPGSWGPLDIFVVIGFLNGSFFSRLHEAITKIKEQNISIEEVAKSFSCSSALRMAVFWVILEYQFSDPKNKSQCREVVDFLMEALEQSMQKDLFAYESNVAHSQEEIEKILKTVSWADGDPKIARELGKLYNSLASLSFALYRDFFPEESNEVYGPYDPSSKFGPNTLLVIKHFPKIKAVELWPQMKDLKNSDIKIFQVFENVSYKCEAIGMHSLYEGDLINGLRKYAVVVDGEYQNDIEKIKELSDYYAEVATKQSQAYNDLSKEELKEKVLEWYSYKFFNFFNLIGMDWRPTKEMLDSVKDKDVAERFELTEFPSYEEYVKDPMFEVYWMKELYT